MLTTFTVNSLDDTDVFNDTDSVVTLREAVFRANQAPDLDTIDFSTNPVHGLNGGTILLTEGELTITESVTIDATMLPLGLMIDAGDGADSTFNTGDGFSVFAILVSPGTGQIEINGLTLTGGDPEGNGGAIYFTGNLSLDKMVITGNATQSSGGGIAAIAGNLTIENIAQSPKTAVPESISMAPPNCTS